MYIQPLPLFVLVASAVLSMGVAPVYAPPPARPPETRLADHCDQLGIDSTPRFGWVVNDLERGERRSAYQIQVAANPNELTGKKALFG